MFSSDHAPTLTPATAEFARVQLLSRELPAPHELVVDMTRMQAGPSGSEVAIGLSAALNDLNQNRASQGKRDNIFGMH